MSILALWQTSPELLKSKTVRQIIAYAGNGKLTEDGLTSKEFRSLLAEVPSELLQLYAGNCLEEAFPDSGFALQDVVNEMGRRLGLQVSSGRYRGKPGVIGNDGTWVLPTGQHIVVEVKTTDAYRIDLDVVAGYRAEMIRTGRMREENSSALIIVGRTDTGDLEAQIRGSRHAWSMRLLSVDALARLVRLKESLEDPESLARIHQLLVPREFTKLDAIVDLVFSTTEDAKGSDDADPSALDENAVTKQGASESKEPRAAFTEACIAVISAKINIPLVRRSRALYSSPDDSFRVVCAVSKAYADPRPNYWFAFHPHQRDALVAAKTGYVAYGCGSHERTLLIPINEVLKWVDGMNRTGADERMYWHIQIFEEDGQLVLVRRKGQPKIPLDTYRL